MKINWKFHFTIYLLLISTNVFCSPIIQDSLNYLSHEHTPIFSGSGDESIVCYKSTHRNAFFIMTGLVLALLLVLLRLFFFSKKMNKTLRIQNAIIEDKNKNITDSINYAKRLQNAILPPTEYVNSILNDYFILYIPKDIVSGDFYWVSEHDNEIVVAAMDCTGHGVPGALLSIVGHNAMVQTINEMSITKPNKVMDSMNNIIKKVLHQEKGSNVKDGMDMAICTYNKTTGQLQYAGANNPLYYISDNQLNVIKASKLTVGTIEDHVKAPPQNHTLQLKKNDCIYIFSDGFADQFGGTENKKYKSSRLRELLLSVNTDSMSIQKQKIVAAFNEWKGHYEQVDDVLLIGIRI